MIIQLCACLPKIYVHDSLPSSRLSAEYLQHQTAGCRIWGFSVIRSCGWCNPFFAETKPPSFADLRRSQEYSCYWIARRISSEHASLFQYLCSVYPLLYWIWLVLEAIPKVQSLEPRKVTMPSSLSICARTASHFPRSASSKVIFR